MANEINPNAPVEDEAVAESKSGELLDFDDVEAIEAQQAPENKEERKEADEAEKVEPEGKEVDDDEGAEEEEQVESEEAKPAGEKHQVETKLVKITDGDTALDISEGATVVTKVDGQLEEVSIADLKTNYSGRVAYDRKFNELAQDKQKFTSQVQFVNDKVNEIRELAESDPMMAFFELCRMNNTTPEEQTQAWQKFADEAGDWNELSDEQKDSKLAIKERDFYKNRIDSDKKRQERALQQARLNSQAEQARKDYGLTEADYEQAEKLAPRVYPEGTTITPREVITTNRISMVNQVLTEVAPDQVFEGSRAFGDLLDSAMRNPNFDIDDLKEMAIKVYGKDSGRNLGRKVKSSKTLSAQPANTQQSGETLTSFDQL